MEKSSSDLETTSICSEVSELSSISDYRPQNKSRKTFQARSKRDKYQNISNEHRAELIKKVIDEKQKIKPTARKLGINYSTAKSILQIYRKEGRVDKKLITRGSSKQFSVAESAEQTEVSKTQDLSLNLESESKETIEQRRYSLRKRETVNKEVLPLPTVKKPDLGAFEPKKVKRVKTTQGHSLKADTMEVIENKSHHQEVSNPGHVASESTNENLAKGLPVIAVKNEHINPEQGSALSAPKSFETWNSGLLSSEIHRRNLLLQMMMMPLLQDYPHQLNPADLMNLSICGLLNPQLEHQASKPMMLAAKFNQNLPMRMPLYLHPDPSLNFLFKSHAFDFNPRCNFKK